MLSDYEYFRTPNGVLYCGDCLEIMPMLPKVDLLLTDPPYGINHITHGQIFKESFSIKGDSDLWAYQYLVSLKKPLCAFYSPYNPPCIKWRSILVWYKGPQVGAGGDAKTCWKRDIELIGIINNMALSGKRDSSLLRFNSAVKKPSGHFCEKPLSLMIYLAKKIPAGITVDPFAGSCTTAIACERLNRKWICIEIDEHYCEISKQRIIRETKQLRLPGGF